MKIIILGTLASSILGFRAALIQKLIADGHQVFAFAIDYSEEEKKILLSWGAVPIDYKLSRSGLNPIIDIKLIFALKKTFELIMPDIVFSYFVKPVVYGSLAAKLANVPKRIAMLEGLGFAFTEQPDRKAIKAKIIKKIQLVLYRVAFPATTHLLFLNTDDRDELLVKHALKARSSSVIGGIGLDLNYYCYQPVEIRKPLSFLYIGRLLKEKGIFEYLAAAKMIKKIYPHVNFTVLGKADHTSPNALSDDELQSCIDNGLIDYPGHVDSVLKWIESCSVFVLPSYREGVPRSTQEAMAVGRPVLTTDVPGCRETVIDGENGFLIPPFNVEALVEKMIWFIANPEKIEPMGLASRKMAEERYDVNKVNARLLKIMGL